MKTSFLSPYLSLFAGVFLTLCFAACKPDPVEPLPSQPQPIDDPTEIQEPITNDFTLVKACIGKPQEETVALLADHGFTAIGDNKFSKTENDVTKKVSVHSVGNVEMYVQDCEFALMKQIFAQWMNEIRNSAAYSHLVRASFQLKEDYNTGYSYNTPEELLDALSTTSPAGGMYASFHGNDVYANEYSLTLFPELGVYMQVVNQRAEQPSDEFTESDLQEADLHKHILISKVDYLTFQYKGFYALNVTDKLDDGLEIPFLADYRPPGDFGSIKLYYRNTDNLLFDGTIIWAGCGSLLFPDSFRAGLPMSAGLPYPGQSRIAFINEEGSYVTVTDEAELQHIWQSVSHQKEFQYYYGHSSKKVAVYLYTPSVGVGNPADASYFVFTEQ